MVRPDSHTYRRGLRRAITEEIERRLEREFGKVTATIDV